MTDTKQFPSTVADKFVVRFPPGMRDQIKEEADKSGRSMNAEIVARLERSFSIAEDAKGLLSSIKTLAKSQERQEVINNAFIAALVDSSKAGAGNDVLRRALKRLVIEVGVFDLKNHKPGESASTAHRLLEASVERMVAHDNAPDDDHAKSEADEKYNEVAKKILDDARAERDSQSDIGTTKKPAKTTPKK